MITDFTKKYTHIECMAQNIFSLRKNPEAYQEYCAVKPPRGYGKPYGWQSANGCQLDVAVKVFGNLCIVRIPMTKGRWATIKTINGWPFVRKGWCD